MIELERHFFNHKPQRLATSPFQPSYINLPVDFVMSKMKTTVRNICTDINWATILVANGLIAAPLLPALVRTF